MSKKTEMTVQSSSERPAPLETRPTVHVALAGNPNSGKTTIFNALTGSRQQVGNYPGVTVEKKQGLCRYQGRRFNVVDLPGTYCLSAYSEEERVDRRYIIEDRPDVVVDVVDASNLERNLYLAVQLMEMRVPLVLVFNMADVARQRGLVFDIPHLSQLLGVPIVETVGNKSEGIDDVLAAVAEMADNPRPPAVNVRFGDEIEKELEHLTTIVESHGPLAARYGARWMALKLLEQDQEIAERTPQEPITEAVQQAAARLESLFGDAPAGPVDLAV